MAGNLFTTVPIVISNILDHSPSHWRQSSRYVLFWCKSPEAFYYLLRLFRTHQKDLILTNICSIKFDKKAPLQRASYLSDVFRRTVLIFDLKPGIVVNTTCLMSLQVRSIGVSPTLLLLMLATWPERLPSSVSPLAAEQWDAWHVGHGHHQRSWRDGLWHGKWVGLTHLIHLYVATLWATNISDISHG